MTVLEVTCQRNNGECNQVCSDVMIGVNCSCHNGYWLIDSQNCSGKQVILGYRLILITSTVYNSYYMQL